MRLRVKGKALFFLHKFSAALLALALPFTASAGETRCGWFENPTPANAWLTDADGEWVLSLQGQGPVPGLDQHWPDFPEDQWVNVQANGRGFGCACFTGEFRADKVIEIVASKALPLKQCIEDRDLSFPELPW